MQKDDTIAELERQVLDAPATCHLPPATMPRCHDATMPPAACTCTYLERQVGELRKAMAGDTWTAGERGFMLNPKFADGTRLRKSPEPGDDNFTEEYVLNDAEVRSREGAPSDESPRSASAVVVPCGCGCGGGGGGGWLVVVVGGRWRVGWWWLMAAWMATARNAPRGLAHYE